MSEPEYVEVDVEHFRCRTLTMGTEALVMCQYEEFGYLWSVTVWRGPVPEVAAEYDRWRKLAERLTFKQAVVEERFRKGDVIASPCHEGVHVPHVWETKCRCANCGFIIPS